MTRRLLAQNALLGALIVISGLGLGETQISCPAHAQASPSKSAPLPAAQIPPAAQSSGTSAVVMDLSAIQSVIGKSVKSSNGEDLGHVVDLLVTASGQIRAAVIDFGGVLGVGSRKIAVDWKILDFASFMKEGTVRLALTRDQVRVSPEYKSGDPVVILQASPVLQPTASVKTPPVPATSSPQGEAHKQ